MYPRFAFALLFSVCAFGLGIAAPAFPDTVPDLPIQFPSKGGFPQCPDNEEFRTCGSACAPSCANPHPSPVCTKNCVIGCFCKQGHLRNARGLCVPEQNCNAPAALFAYPPEISQCKENEVFMPCGSACAPTCANPHPGPVCTLQCVVGCFCKPGYLKNEHGVCVPSETCGVPAAQAVPLPPQVCGDNEEFRQCKGCDGTCDKPNPLCPRICVPGCACKQGHLRSGANGKCILSQQCPKVDPIPPTSFMMLPPVPKCGENEVFHSCGTACPATCANPHPSPVCTKNCVIGCFCKEGFLKNEQGVCVAASNCVASKPDPRGPVHIPLFAQPAQHEGQCASDREIYSECGQQLDCLASCGTPLPFLIHGYPQLPKKCLERSCTPGCVCKKPYVRNTDGRCVERNECQHNNPFATTPSH